MLASWTFVAAYSAFTDWDYYHLFWRTEARLGSVFCSAWLVCWLRDGHRPLVRGGAVLVPLLLGVAVQADVVPDAIKYTLGTALLAVAVTHLRFASDWLVPVIDRGGDPGRRAFVLDLSLAAAVHKSAQANPRSALLGRRSHRGDALLPAGRSPLDAGSTPAGRARGNRAARRTCCSRDQGPSPPIEPLPPPGRSRPAPPCGALSRVLDLLREPNDIITVVAASSGGIWALPLLIALACSGGPRKPSVATSTGGASGSGGDAGGGVAGGGGAAGSLAAGGATAGNAGGGAGGFGGRAATAGTGGAASTAGSAGSAGSAGTAQAGGSTGTGGGLQLPHSGRARPRDPDGRHRQLVHRLSPASATRASSSR